MKKIKILGMKGVEWLQYLVFTAFLFFFFYVGDFFFKLGERGPIFMFAFWFIVIISSDKIVQKVLGSK